MKKNIAEIIGTFALVFFGCGSAVLMGDQIGFLGIAFAFGLAVTAMAYSVGQISGAHLNPAVSIGVLLSGGMSVADFVSYVISQCIGAIAAAAVLLMIASGTADYTLATGGLGQNGWGAGYNGEYNMTAALVFEFVGTLLFVTVILGAVQSGASNAFAGLVIGLTLVAVHLVGINVTGTSVNPARSLGPALLVGGAALSQLWLFIVAPLAGGAVAGLLFAAGITRRDDV